MRSMTWRPGRWFAMYSECHCAAVAAVESAIAERCPEHGKHLIEGPQLVGILDIYPDGLYSEQGHSQGPLFEGDMK